MVELTIGYVAGIIAVGVVLAITFFLAGQLSDRATATTWTADSSQNTGVRTSVILITIAIPCLAVLVSIAGIVTPMGLYEQDKLSSDWELGWFQYVADAGAFSQCSYGGYRAPCPYTSDTMVYKFNGSVGEDSYPTGLNATIYMSGTKNRKTTVPGFFDIKWRKLTTKFDLPYSGGEAIAAWVYRYLESFLLSDEIRAVEGLVVDAKDGGVGLRNHTLPTEQTQGATWSEDLLFLEPEVECVAMNLRIDFEVTMDSQGVASSFGISQMNLTDHGGFLNLSNESPLRYQQENVNQPNKPELKTRIYQAAWFINFLTMLVMNIMDVRNDTLGTKRLERRDSVLGQQFQIPIPTLVPEMVQGVQFCYESGAPIGLSAATFDDPGYPNPLEITYKDLNGPYMSTRPNNTYVSCLLVQGAPQRIDKGVVTIFEHESRWSSPLYTCASAAKATKTRETYENEADMPLWGFENWFMSLDDFQPIWGLVDASLKSFDNVTTLQAPEFYFLRGRGGGGVAPLAAFRTLEFSSGLSYGGTDFSGRGRMSLWLKWKLLSRSPDTMSGLIKLLWTDVMASAIVGSKGALGSRNMEPSEAPDIQMQVTVHKIKYHWAFGVPAFLVLLRICLVFIIVVGSGILGRSTLETIRRRLNQVSLGRVITTIYFPEQTVWGIMLVGQPS
ncbi:hypothetical protein B0T10DRAFT_530289 [Thelonectria olida]|uniref:Uncharacterized protein n=1 Tax=Thelonectria olida TaxID=1576542 RepID=A0A9P8W1Y6_9HYPO|nr:hypothetical protein B0T10DRAFT_530289 [Thelonectria olida]